MASNYSNIPEVSMSSSSRKIPIVGLGTATFPPVGSKTVVAAVLQAIQIGYRHFDTASVYQTESDLGEAIAEALRLGLIKSREELFTTSKLWCSDAHAQHVVPTLQKTLKNLNLDYLDLYLVHWPVSVKHGTYDYPIKTEDIIPMDYESVWGAMEECHKLGLAKAIGVSNFSCKKLGHLLSFAKIPPAVNQVEMNPVWQQRKLVEFCKENGVLVGAFSPLGALGTSWGSNNVMESEILKEIAKAKGKTVAQVSLRWAYEQGVIVLVKSYRAERMQENLGIFDWELSDEDTKKIREIPQRRVHRGEEFISENGPFKSIEEFWDGEL
uniref:Reductase 1 n=1 Tax=Hydrangea macrophylla TaxID=23110 RepID=Q6TY49_HYDMC|nr:reductase 1 [Hydrangea macrophylla]AAR89811.1 reductase 1 [Hydrangea macrophylla]